MSLAPGVTVVIPNWNHRSFLPRSLRTARAALAAVREMGLDGEVIVIDDASRDGSQKLLRSLTGLYGWPDVLTVELLENGGLAAARNLGLESASFSHVLFLDADNEVFPHGVVTLLQSARVTGAALCYGNLLDHDGMSIVGLRSHEAPSLRLTHDNFIDALALVDVVQARAIGGYVGDRRLQYWADWEFVLHLIAEELEVVFVPCIVGIYYIIPLSMLGESGNDQQRDRKLMHRVFAQTGIREWDVKRVGRIHHPAVGYLDGVLG